MSLVGFHKFLIGCAVLFCVGFAGWRGLAYGRGGGISDLVVALAFGVVAVGLGYYLRHLDRFLGGEG